MDTACSEFLAFAIVPDCPIAAGEWPGECRKSVSKKDVLSTVPEILRHLMPLTRYPYLGEVSPCPVCGCSDATLVASLDRRFKRLPTSSCDRCGLLFTNPLPTDEELSVYYEKFYRLDYHWASSVPLPRHVQKAIRFAETRAENLSDFIQSGGRTLDVGCGRGELVGLMLQRGHDAHGVEPGETYGSYAKQQFGDRIQTTTWQKANFRQKFDLVTCFHVLEHLREPLPALQQIADWLHPDGFAYIEVPDLGGKDAQKGFGALHFAHVLGFNHHNFLLAANRAGLCPERVISPTEIIFRHGGKLDQQTLAAEGLRLSTALYGDGRAYRRYVRYRLGLFSSAVLTARIPANDESSERHRRKTSARSSRR